MYHIKTMAVAADSASQYKAAQIEQMFSTLDPAAASQAGSAHTQASRTLANIADSLVQHVQKLNENWSGTAAQAAVVSFQQLHETAVGLAQASAQTGAVLSWLGDTILPFYKNYQAPGNGLVGDVESLFGDNPQDKAAQAVMERLNNRLVQANENLPPSVTKTLPTGFASDHGAATTNNVGSSGTGAGQAASGLGGGAGGGVVRLGGAGGTGGAGGFGDTAAVAGADGAMAGEAAGPGMAGFPMTGAGAGGREGSVIASPGWPRTRMSGLRRRTWSRRRSAPDTLLRWPGSLRRRLAAPAGVAVMGLSLVLTLVAGHPAGQAVQLTHG